MAVVVADRFPVRRSSCIIRKFAATHNRKGDMSQVLKVSGTV